MMDATWLARLQARAAQAPVQPRVALRAGPHTIGSLLPDVGPRFGGGLLQPDQGGWQVQGELTQTLNQLARQMRDTRLGHVAHYWRNEQLGVYDEGGAPLGSVERGAVRPLGIATRAVHLVGVTEPGQLWVQQRAMNKPTNPGMWDTLMGGMVSAEDTIAEAVERETWEEAGLHLAALGGVTHHGHFTATRPVPDGGGAGYLVEDTHWYTATVPHGLVPVNQDGEVDHFECWTPQRVRDAVAQGLFTPEAAWVLTRVLGPGVGD